MPETEEGGGDAKTLYFIVDKAYENKSGR